MPFKAMVTSDWNECLAPCGPFDSIAFNFPAIESELHQVFRLYTGNRITLADAIRQIEKMLPQPITTEQMDAYLAESFSTYTGVPELIEWCLEHCILFMINTTGTIGYFQRIFAGNLLPRVPVISAHPLIRYPIRDNDMPAVYELFETRDKSRNTAAVADKHSIRADKIVIMGDSGGDGPHFEWGSQNGAFLISCMTKPSLADYCRTRSIGINLDFGINDPHNKTSEEKDEFQINYMDLANVIEEIANR